ncbi:MAG: 1-(5-phosphoribosyl)-5-[(5-phosphoribosylamino)methylideneamino]imidazole-4-carboxamide isomerase [Myxococcota bacterium]
MELIPAVDILGGKVVRLHRGDYDKVTVYDDDPGAAAARFEQVGATRLHVVDLDGARAGEPRNVEAIGRILARSSLAVQVGGGVRDTSAARRWLDAGASRVVIGTAAIKHPDFARRLCAEHPNGVIVALDARDGQVAVEGWLEGSGRRVEDVAPEVDGWGAAALLYTNIERDGTRQGPDVEGTAALQRRVSATVIASGGIGRIDDLRALAAAGVRAAVCGRALYSGAFTLEEAVEALRG